MSGDPLDLDAIEARLANAGANLYTLGTEDVPALVAEVRRLRALEAEVQGVRGVLAVTADLNTQGGQWAGGYRAACLTTIKELDSALGVKVE